MANPHHDATHRHQWGRGKTEFLRPKQRGDDHVTPGFQLAVGLNDNARAQIVQHQGLVRLGQTKLPGNTGMLDTRLRRGAGAAVVATNEHDVCVCLRHTCRHGADADLSHKLHADARMMICILQVVN